MEQYLAMAAGAMTGFGISTLHSSFQGAWWLSIPAGALGGLAGRALWSEALASAIEDSSIAGTAVAAVIGGAALGLIATVARRLLVWRLRSAPLN